MIDANKENEWLCSQCNWEGENHLNGHCPNCLSEDLLNAADEANFAEMELAQSKSILNENFAWFPVTDKEIEKSEKEMLENPIELPESILNGNALKEILKKVGL